MAVDIHRACRASDTVCWLPGNATRTVALVCEALTRHEFFTQLIEQLFFRAHGHEAARKIEGMILVVRQNFSHVIKLVQCELGNIKFADLVSPVPSPRPYV